MTFPPFPSPPPPHRFPLPDSLFHFSLTLPNNLQELSFSPLPFWFHLSITLLFVPDFPWLLHIKCSAANESSSYILSFFVFSMSFSLGFHQKTVEVLDFSVRFPYGLFFFSLFSLFWPTPPPSFLSFFASPFFSRFRPHFDTV